MNSARAVVSAASELGIDSEPLMFGRVVLFPPELGIDCRHERSDSSVTFVRCNRAIPR